jgi:lysophospholipase L1-like esterase
MHTKRFDDNASKQVPRWAFGTALATVAVVTGALLVAGGGDGGGALIQPAAEDNAITGTVAVDDLNVRAIEPGTTTVDLTADPVTTLTSGAIVRVMCQFTGVEVPEEGSQWYQITDVAGGAGTLAAFAPYITVPPDVQIPACAGGQAPPPPIADDSKRYVAMGESFSAGEGAKDYLPGTDQFGGCHRSRNAYPMLIARERPHFSGDNMAFVACSGAVTDNITTVGQNNEPPQINPGLGKNTELVTISIGVNDIGFAQVLANCYVSPQGCDGQKPGVADKLTALPEKLRKTYAAIKDKAPNARLVVLTYPQIFMAHMSGTTCVEEFRLASHLQWLRETTHKLNEIIKTAATAAGATYVDVENALQGHELCTGGDTQVVHAQDSLADFHEWFHPTAEGHTTITKQILATI